MEDKHEHNLKRVYYRKKEKDKKYQDWVTIENIRFCDICKKILEYVK